MARTSFFSACMSRRLASDRIVPERLPSHEPWRSWLRAQPRRSPHSVSSFFCTSGNRAFHAMTDSPAGGRAAPVAGNAWSHARATAHMYEVRLYAGLWLDAAPGQALELGQSATNRFMKDNVVSTTASSTGPTGSVSRVAVQSAIQGRDGVVVMPMCIIPIPRPATPRNTSCHFGRSRLLPGLRNDSRYLLSGLKRLSSIVFQAKMKMRLHLPVRTAV